jgi:hypothetical protein
LQVIPSPAVQSSIMPKTLKLEPHLDTEELENRYRKAREPVERSHYQIVWLISEGEKTSEVMDASGYCRDWIQKKIARRYNDGGPDALGDRSPSNPGAKERAALLNEEGRRELAPRSESPLQQREVELSQGRRMDRAKDRKSALQAEGLGISAQSRTQPEGSQTAP